MESVPVGQIVSLGETLGVPAIILFVTVIFFLLRHSDEKRFSQDLDREKVRAGEHIQKWNDMMSTHKIEQDRQFSLYQRQTEVLELHARLLTIIDARLSEKTMCPINNKRNED